MFAYFGLLVVAVRGVPREARLRVAGTWIVSATVVTALAWSVEESGGDTGAALIAGVVVAALLTVAGIASRKSERAWPYVVAGSLGGVTPVALVVALFAWFFANGGCLG